MLLWWRRLWFWVAVVAAVLRGEGDCFGGFGLVTVLGDCGGRFWVERVTVVVDFGCLLDDCFCVKMAVVVTCLFGGDDGCCGGGGFGFGWLWWQRF